MRKLLALTLVAAMCSIAIPASAQLIDQNQPSGPVYMAAFSQGDLAQSFQQTHANIVGAGILLQGGVGTTDLVTISLWNLLPNVGGAVMLASASAQGTAGEWVDVYWSLTPVTPATTYYLVFTGNATLGIAGDTNNPYPYGQVYANAGFGSWPAFDYAFRTYYDDITGVDSSSLSAIKALY